ncbi:MAG: helix-turn-helix domain-containing protein [Candidatus Binatia bacterium]
MRAPGGIPRSPKKFCAGGYRFPPESTLLHVGRKSIRPAVAAYLRRCENRRERADATEFAHYVRMSRQALHRRFLEEFGEPPGGYLRRRQLAKAPRLLTRFTVDQVAERLGRTPRSFRRAYKRLFQRTPRSERR